MKKTVTIGIVALTLLLDLLALDDITTNKENHLTEYIFLLLSLPMIYFFIIKLSAQTGK
ncbi:MAG: hypothetical protein HY429_02850 [Candidatus Levybacteria bacterium]|nr:hypothetical protein [Candidatus Levybacteria bacterium]